MADNAIDKLFEEMREAQCAYEEAQARVNEVFQAQVRAKEEVDKARERVVLLDKTLAKHIHEGLPVVQAKMVAHEEQEANAEIHSRISAEATVRANAHTALTGRRSTLLFQNYRWLLGNLNR